jgi:nucleoside-diphosphate-sugar epimerase
VDLTSQLLANYDQVVIYGAKGWMGRSAVELLTREEQHFRRHQILLIGSKTELAHNAKLPVDVFSANEATQYLGQKILFLNAAYLRREKLNEMKAEEYEKKNEEVIEFALDQIKSGKIKTFINLSSGVASQGSLENLHLVTDLYAKAKIRDEALLSKACELIKIQLINCRIYAMTGKFVNEFNNLALTSFIGQAIKDPYSISVKSPTTLRTYIDSGDLVEVLFRLALTGNNYQIDSGGELTSLGNLANVVSDAAKGSTVEKPENFEKSADYFGNYLEFNELAAKCGISLKNINEQVTETFKAFL